MLAGRARSPKPRALLDGNLALPESLAGRFRLNGSVLEVPDYENADTFVDRLVRDGLIALAPEVAAALRGETAAATSRTLQRRFAQGTGITLSGVRQIERARYATVLLQQGVAIAETAYRACYFDQPHLTRSLRRFIGQTPAELQAGRSSEMSFLYKTWPFSGA